VFPTPIISPIVLGQLLTEVMDSFPWLNVRLERSAVGDDDIEWVTPASVPGIRLSEYLYGGYDVAVGNVRLQIFPSAAI
jgi:hypothetical protein